MRFLRRRFQRAQRSGFFHFRELGPGMMCRARWQAGLLKFPSSGVLRRYGSKLSPNSLAKERDLILNEKIDRTRPAGEVIGERLTGSSGGRFHAGRLELALVVGDTGVELGGRHVPPGDFPKTEVLLSRPGLCRDERRNLCLFSSSRWRCARREGDAGPRRFPSSISRQACRQSVFSPRFPPFVGRRSGSIPPST